MAMIEDVESAMSSSKVAHHCRETLSESMVHTSVFAETSRLRHVVLHDRIGYPDDEVTDQTAADEEPQAPPKSAPAPKPSMNAPVKTPVQKPVKVSQHLEMTTYTCLHATKREHGKYRCTLPAHRNPKSITLQITTEINPRTTLIPLPRSNCRHGICVA